MVTVQGLDWQDVKVLGYTTSKAVVEFLPGSGIFFRAG
jgi:hypothetical protein